jgi:pimeloyl-ACP methyl ester carboxylesterase
MKHLLQILLGILLIFAPVSEVISKTRPVIIVPAIMGSKLCNATGTVLWGDRASYTADRINALLLPPNVNERDPTIKSCGLIESINIIPLLWETDVYDRLLIFLKRLGYSDDDIVTFHYDWRLSNFETAKRLKTTVDAIAGSGKVDIIAHSMGGLISRIYFQTMGGSAKVNNLIMLGTPHRGSAKIFQRLRDGFDYWPNALSGGLPKLQKTILSFPSRINFSQHMTNAAVSARTPISKPPITRIFLRQKCGDILRFQMSLRTAITL